MTIKGTGFPSASTIDIRIDGIYLVEGIQTDNGTFEVVIEIPDLPLGEKTVRATAWFMREHCTEVTNPFTVLPPQTTIPPPPTPTGPPPSPGPEPGGGVPPWIWSIPPTIIIAGAGGYSLKRWMDTRRIKVRLYKDNGTQQIESGTPIHPDSEIGLRPVLDPGKQSIEAEDSSVVNEWRKKP